jgi:phosphoribosylanthranilate isomerase
MEIKICGLTRVDQAVAIARLGVTAVGLVCVLQLAPVCGSCPTTGTEPSPR